MTMAAGICSNGFDSVGSNVNRTEMILYTYKPLHSLLYTEQAPHDKSIKIVLAGSHGRNVLFFVMRHLVCAILPSIVPFCDDCG